MWVNGPVVSLCKKNPRTLGIIRSIYCSHCQLQRHYYVKTTWRRRFDVTITLLLRRVCNDDDGDLQVNTNTRSAARIHDILLTISNVRKIVCGIIQNHRK